MSDVKKHCAPFSLELLPVIADLLSAYSTAGLVLDPFAGIGRVHQLRQYGYTTVGVELEREWAEQSIHTHVGNALALRFVDDLFDAVVTSPTYGNRMADHHVARDKSHRRTYKHYLGRDLSRDNSGGLQWGQEYRDFHQRAWEEVHRVLAPGGIFILNCKDHIRNGRRAHVTNWHYQALKALGFELVAIRRVGTPGYRFGANRNARCVERLLVFRKPGPIAVAAAA